MWKVLATSMRCLHCGKKLSLLRKFSDGEFCSAEHRQIFQQQQSDLALARLLEAREKIEEPVVAAIPAVRGVVKAEEKGKPARLPEPAVRHEADDPDAPLYERAFPVWPAAVQRAWLLRSYDRPFDPEFPAEYPAAGLKINISRFGVAGLSALNEEFIPTPASRLPKNGVSAIPFAGAFALPPHEAGTPPEFLLSEAGLVPVAYAGPVNRPLCILANEFDAIACPQGALALPNVVPVAHIPDFDAMLAAAIPVDAEEDIAAQVVIEPESPAEPEAAAEPIPGLIEELRPILLAGAIARQFRRMELEQAERSVQVGLAIPALLTKQEEARITRAFHSHPLQFESRPAAAAVSCRALSETAQIEFASAPSAMPGLTSFRREPAPAMSFAEEALAYPTARTCALSGNPASVPAHWLQSALPVPAAPAAAIRINGGRMAKPKDQCCLPVYEPLPSGMGSTVRAADSPAAFGTPIALYMPVAAPPAEAYRLPEPEPVVVPERQPVAEPAASPAERPRRLRAAGQPKPAIDLRAAMGFRSQDRPVAETQPELEAPIALPVAPQVADEPAKSPQLTADGADNSAPPLFAKLVPTPTLRGCGGKSPVPRCSAEAVWTDSFDRAPFLPRPKFAVLSAEPAAEERRSAFSSLSDKLQPLTTLSRSNRFWKYAPADLKWISLAIPIILVVVIYSFKPSPSKVSAGPSVATTATSESSTLLGSQLASVKNVIMERAAVKLFDDFRGGLSSWQGEEGWSKTWKYDQSSFLEPGKLALYTPTVRMSDYRFSFLGQIDTRSLNWVFRAKDEKNYYAMRIVITKPGPLPSADVVRYAVIDGKEVQRKSFPLPFSIRQDTLYQVEMDVRGNQFTTYLQGQIVDSFTDDQFAQGGVGFFNPKGDRSLLRWVEVTYQYDYLGRLCAMLAPYSAHAEGRRVE